MKEYILLKDLPNAHLGTILKLSRNKTCYTFSDKYGGNATISVKLVESNPEWFKEASPFVWTDELVREYAARCICDFAYMKFSGGKSNHSSITIEDFKRSKQ